MHPELPESRGRKRALAALLPALLLAACSSAPEPAAPSSPPPPPPPADIRTALVGKWKSITEFRYHQPDGDVITADLFLEFFPDGRFEIASQSRDGRGQDRVTKNDRSGTYKILDSNHIEIQSKGKPETWEVKIVGDELHVRTPELASDTIEVYNRVPK